MTWIRSYPVRATSSSMAPDRSRAAARMSFVAGE